MTTFLIILSVVLFFVGHALITYCQDIRGVYYSSEWSPLQEFVADNQTWVRGLAHFIQIVAVFVVVDSLAHYEIVRGLTMLCAGFVLMSFACGTVVLVFSIGKFIFHPITVYGDIHRKWTMWKEDVEHSLRYNRDYFVADTVTKVACTAALTLLCMKVFVVGTGLSA